MSNLRSPLLRIVVVLLGLAALASPARATDAEASAPMVRALLFYAQDCPPCDAAFDYLLPALHEHYGKRLQIAAVDASRPEGAALYRAAAGHGVPPEWTGQPTAVVAKRVIVGTDAIAAELGDAFETLATDPAAGRWPDLPGLPALLAEGLGTVQARIEAAPTLEGPATPRPEATGDRDRIANALAVVVLVGMIGALAHAVVRVRRGGDPAAGGIWLIPALALVGIGVSAYTGYTSLAGVSPVCGPIGSCDLVQKSEYARLFGIPMGVLGVLGYAVVLGAWVLGRRLSPEGSGWRWLPWAIAFAGVLFSIRLTALEPFVIGHTCLWCLASAITMTSLLWLLSGETRKQRGQTPLIASGPRT